MIINTIQEKWLVTEFMKKNREPGTLPADFKEKMKLLLGDEYEAYVKSFEEPCHNGLRINRLKIDKETWNQSDPFLFPGLRTVFITLPTTRLRRQR